jgi:transcription termination factor Rho
MQSMRGATSEGSDTTVTDTQEQASAANSGAQDGTAAPSRAKRASLSTMLLPELQQVASGMGINTTKLKKSDLVAAIKAAQSGGGSAKQGDTARARKPAAEDTVTPVESANGTAERRPAERPRREPRSATRTAGKAPDATADAGSTDQASSQASPDTSAETGGNAGSTRTRNADGQQSRQRNRDENRDQQGDNRQNDNRDRQSNNQTENRDRQSTNPNSQGGGQNNRNNQNNQSGGQSQNNNQNSNQNNNNQNNNNQNNNNQNSNNQNSQGVGQYDDDDSDGGRRRGRRYRDRRGRNRERVPGDNRASGGNDVEPSVADDDVLIPVAGILDAIEDKNMWFVRTEGYFASPDDVYVANSYVRKFGLRRGDAVTGAIRQMRDGERREKYNPLVRLDTVNGKDPEESKGRVEFTRLTPLYPQERLRLETEPHILTTRVIDLVMPIGKGQRALIVSPPKAGKTMVLQAIANAIATNNPECHLMVVLVDERPEEVTDMQRSVKGEVIASTFDRKPVDHTTVAELSIERAKRLVEMGHDVVVLLDSITRLGRAYNLAAPASGRILSGGVDSTALYPPKRFLGAARNIENGGSLTILCTALVETGSAGDTVIFEEFKGTGNAELKLDRKISDKRIFPAVDVDQSSTRKEELLLSPDELAVTIKLRRVLHALDSQQALDLLLDRLRKTRNNLEFLMQIAKTTPGQD